MRVIILNMMILGAVSCLVENDVFAGNIDPNKHAKESTISQSENLLGTEDLSDSFDQLFFLDESEKNSESLNNSDSKNKKDNNTSSNGKKSKKRKKHRKKNKNNASYETNNFAPYNRQPTYSTENDLKENINILNGLSDSKSSNESFSKSEKNSEGNEKYNNNLKQNYDSESKTEQDFYTQTEDNLSQSESGTESGLPSTQPTLNGNTNVSTQSPAQKGNANVPPPPPPPAMMGNTNVPPPPPPPAMMGNTNVPPPPPMFGMSIERDASDLMKGLRGKLNELLTSDGVIPMANVVNFYLQGNKEIISEGIKIAGDSSAHLIKQLNEERENLNKMFAGNSTVKEICDLLKSLEDPLQKLSKQSYYAISSDRGEFFEKVSQEIREIAALYFSKFMKSGENLKSIPNLISTLKKADIVMERAVVLSNSFSNLANLSEMPRLEEFSERATLDAIEIIKLKRFFAEKLKEANSTSSNGTDDSTSPKKNDVKPLSGTVTLPTGNAVTEKEVVEKAVHYIEETLNGTNQLPALLAIRDVLNNKYTLIMSKEENNTGDKTKSSPLNVIRRLSDRIADVGTLVGKAGKAGRNGDYSQFGKMFTEEDESYGTSLIRSVNGWISSEKFTEFNIALINAEFRGKKLTGDIIGEYIKLLTEDKALCSKSFADSIINKMNSQAKFKSNAYAFAAKQSKQKTESKMEDHQFLFEIMAGDGKTKLGTSSDPKKDKNMISFSTLKKNCEGYIRGMASIDEDIREIPEMLKKVERSFSVEIDNEKFAEYINNILKNYFVFEDFVTHGDKINLSVVNKKDGLLSEKDVPNVVFALAQNCGLVVKQPASPLFSISRDTDNIWVFKMSRDLFEIISKTKKAILDAHAQIFSGKKEITGTKIEEIIKELENLEKLIGNAIYQDEVLENVVQGLSISVSKTKADAKEEAGRVPAENIDEIKLGKITDQVQNLSRLADTLPNPYAQNNQSKIQTIKSVIEEVISLVKTASDTKAKAKLSQKPNRRNAGLVR